jgi:tetratricopeptide (TPR) repeat protein
MTKEEIKAFVQTQIDGSTKRIDEITRALSRPDQGFDKQGYPINRIDSGALPNEYWQRAKDYESIGEHQHAKEDYDTAITLFERLPLRYRDLDLAGLYTDTRQYQKAVDYYSKLLSIATPVGNGYVIFPPSSNIRYPDFNLEEIRLRRAKNYYQLADYQNAVADYGSVIRNFQNGHWEAWYERAKAYIGLGDYQKAVDDCTTAIEKTEASNKKYAEDYAREPSAETCGHGKWPKQSPQTNYNLHLKPIAAPSYYWRAIAYEKLGKLDLAARDKEMASKLGYKPETSRQGNASGVRVLK